MAASHWVTLDETARHLLLRCARTTLPLFSHIPLRAGDVLEIAGPSGSAKSHLLLQMAVECLLPKDCHRGFESAVVCFDLDARFDSSALLHLLRSRLPSAAQLDGQRLLSQCLDRFCYIRCYNSVQFLAALKNIPARLTEMAEQHKNGVRLILIDSIGAFYWLDRACLSTSSAVGDCDSGPLSRSPIISLQAVAEAVVRELRQLLHTFPILIAATKTSIFTAPGNVSLHAGFSSDRTGFTSVPKDFTHSTAHACHNIKRVAYREHMPAVWQGFVTHRLLLRGPYHSETSNRELGNSPVFVAEWEKPSTNQAQLFVVHDGEIKMIS